MPRQTKKIPARLHRFNYWRFVEFAPRPADELAMFSTGRIVEEAKTLTWEQFEKHREGQPCRVPGCAFDRLLLNGPPAAEHAYQALRHLVQSKSEWKQDKRSQCILKELPPQQRAYLEQLHEKTWGGYRRDRWDQLLKRIAKDQILFQEMLMLNARQKMEEVFFAMTDRYGMPDETARDIYRAYSAQRQLLLGEVTSPRVKRAILKRERTLSPISRPPIPRKREHDQQSDQEEKSFFDSGGSVIDYDNDGEEISPEDRDKMVFHWFAHCLVNLRRYKNGHPPIPWHDGCASRCKSERNRLASGHSSPPERTHLRPSPRHRSR